jgi:hypothetical protein
LGDLYARLRGNLEERLDSYAGLGQALGGSEVGFVQPTAVLIADQQGRAAQRQAEFAQLAEPAAAELDLRR